jgi:hypothetical protein
MAPVNGALGIDESHVERLRVTGQILPRRAQVDDLRARGGDPYRRGSGQVVTDLPEVKPQGLLRPLDVPMQSLLALAVLHPLHVPEKTGHHAQEHHNAREVGKAQKTPDAPLRSSRAEGCLLGHRIHRDAAGSDSCLPWEMRLFGIVPLVSHAPQQ